MQPIYLAANQSKSKTPKLKPTQSKVTPLSKHRTHHLKPNQHNQPQVHTKTTHYVRKTQPPRSLTSTQTNHQQQNTIPINHSKQQKTETPQLKINKLCSNNKSQMIQPIIILTQTA